MLCSHCNNLFNYKILNNNLGRILWNNISEFDYCCLWCSIIFFITTFVYNKFAVHIITEHVCL